jgi:DNA modification methylase
VPYERNARTHSAEQVAQIVASIREFGFTNPILVDGADGILAGHGRLAAAKEMGLAEVPVIVLDHLSAAQRKAYILADNQLALNAGWDMELLRFELGELGELGFDLSLLGFDDEQLAELAPEVEELPPEDADADAVPEAPEEPITKPGDVWLLGKHRLMCGDSTDVLAVERLMDGKKADMVFTDPPYGVSYEGGLQDTGNGLKSAARRKLMNDDIDLYYDAVVVANQFSNGPVFMFHADTVPFGLYKGVEAVGGEIVALLIWRKPGGYGALGASYKLNHEPCLLWKPKGAKLNYIGPTTETRIWEIDKEKQNKLHPTQKPVAVPERAIANHKAQLVLDLFGGSGSTLIACERQHRHARLMELDPAYCDVIVKRWQQFTGKTATLEATGEPFPAEL